MKYNKFLIAIFSLFITLGATSSNANEMFFKAMRDECSRNMNKLKLDSIKKPYYLEYRIRQVYSFAAKASLGVLIDSDKK